MNNEDQIYHLIENYLRGELSGNKLNDFEKELKLNQDLNKKVKAHKLANDMVIEYRLQSVQSILQKEKINYERNSLWRKIISVISGGLILASLLFFVLNKDASKDDISKTETSHLIPGNLGSLNQTDPKTNKIPQRDNYKQLEKSIKYNNPIIYNDSSLSSYEQINEPQVLHHQILKVNEEHLNQKQSSETVNICDHVEIIFDISVKQSCEGENNGSIITSGFKGGTPPYHYYVSQNNNEYNHSHLSAGTYTVIIKDSKGCIKNIPDIEIIEKHCQKDYSFNPFIGETWEIPTYKNSGTLIVYDEGGIVYFTEEIGAGTKQQWSGQSKNGEDKTGFFLFVINYKDGTIRQGSVTIVR